MGSYADEILKYAPMVVAFLTVFGILIGSIFIAIYIFLNLEISWTELIKILNLSKDNPIRKEFIADIKKTYPKLMTKRKFCEYERKLNKYAIEKILDED